MPDETVDLSDRVDALEQRVARHEGLVEVVTGLTADLATIASALDPALAQHVAELDAKLERHDLLLARLLDKQPDNT